MIKFVKKSYLFKQRIKLWYTADGLHFICYGLINWLQI